MIKRLKSGETTTVHPFAYEGSAGRSNESTEMHQ